MRRKKTLVETLQSPHPVSGEAESSEGGEVLSWSGNALRATNLTQAPSRFLLIQLAMNSRKTVEFLERLTIFPAKWPS